jgi:hypothetical protein
MAVRLSGGLKNFALDSGLGTAFDGGTGRINVYTGAQPATADTAASGTLLGTLTLSSDSFAAASSGAIAINSVTSDTSADNSGTAGYVRFYRTGDTAPGSAGGATDRRLDLLIGTDISIDNASIVAGGTIALSGYTLTHGG